VNDENILQQRLASHLRQVHVSAQHNEFIDLEPAGRLHDLRSPIGFEDDIEVVEAALRQLSLRDNDPVRVVGPHSHCLRSMHRRRGPACAGEGPLLPGQTHDHFLSLDVRARVFAPSWAGLR
jgi:hypothetical protein